MWIHYFTFIDLLPPWKLEVGGGSRFTRKFPWKLVEVDLLPWSLVEASMEIHGIVYCRWKWNLPLLPSIAASTKKIRGSFHELPYTPKYFHLIPRVPQTSGCIYKNSVRVHRIPFDVLPWNFPLTSMETSIEVN